MPISSKAVIRVIIEGEWIWVERGTFTLMPLEFEDENGNILNPSREPIQGYFFTSTNGDPYFGPLNAIKLVKLDSQILEETGSTPSARTRAHELGTGTGETFGGDLGPEAPTDAPPPSDDEARKPPGKSVPLFADDVDESDEDATGEQADHDDDDDPSREPTARKRGGGLF